MDHSSSANYRTAKWLTVVTVQLCVWYGAALAAVGCELLLACGAARVQPPVEVRSCASCHPNESARWQSSHHARALQQASSVSVSADFTSAAVGGTGFRRTGDEFFFALLQPSAALRVRFTLGVEPLQQYLVELPGGRLQVFPLAWDTERKRWFRATTADLPWTSRYHTWNTMCADCHSTGVQKRYDAVTDRFDTRFDAASIGCKACHGAAEDHVKDPTRAVPVHREPEDCAPCHSRRATLTEAAAEGGAFLDHYRPLTLQPGLYFADGQIRDEVFEYGSFAQSVMHARGVRCIDCHESHSGNVLPGNAVCTACHGVTPAPARFPGLAARAANVDSPAHHHHAQGSSGARCVSCHMPDRTYMGVDRRHDHSLRVPRPDLSATLGTPNACTQACHRERDARWARDVVASWFPGAKPAHFGEVFERAQRGDAGAQLGLQKLARDTSQPSIVRATALELLLGDAAGCLAAASGAVLDSSALVRSTALACAEHLPARERAGLAAAGLHDATRLVRIEAARVLAGDGVDGLSGAQRTAFATARRELEAAYRAELDRPESWFNLALLAQAESLPERAIADLQRALQLDPAFAPARVHLHQLEHRAGTNKRQED